MYLFAKKHIFEIFFVKKKLQRGSQINSPNDIWKIRIIHQKIRFDEKRQKSVDIGETGRFAVDTLVLTKIVLLRQTWQFDRFWLLFVPFCSFFEHFGTHRRVCPSTSWIVKDGSTDKSRWVAMQNIIRFKLPVTASILVIVIFSTVHKHFDLWLAKQMFLYSKHA